MKNQPVSEEMSPVEIPLLRLSESALKGVIDNFILREGSDYGLIEVGYERKVSQIQAQISKGEIKILFDPNTDSVSLMTEVDFLRKKL